MKNTTIKKIRNAKTYEELKAILIDAFKAYGNGMGVISDDDMRKILDAFESKENELN